MSFLLKTSKAKMNKLNIELNNIDLECSSYRKMVGILIQSLVTQDGDVDYMLKKFGIMYITLVMLNGGLIRGAKFFHTILKTPIYQQIET